MAPSPSSELLPSYSRLGAPPWAGLLGLRTETMLRRSVDALALAAIVLLIILRNNIVFEIATDPFPYVIVPAWAIVAYCCAGIRIKKEDPA